MGSLQKNNKYSHVSTPKGCNNATPSELQHLGITPSTITWSLRDLKMKERTKVIIPGGKSPRKLLGRKAFYNAKIS